MSQSTPGSVFGSTMGALAGLHGQDDEPTVLAGPATDKQFNTLRVGTFPFACWRMEDMRFEFDSSVISAGSVDDLGLLKALVAQHPGAPLSVFGHADPTGNDEYNKALSGRRAKAVYALLTRRVDMWEELYKQPSGGDDWSKAAAQPMLALLGFNPGSGPATSDQETNKAVKDFQSSEGLASDGIVGPKTRARLFEKYMDALCTPEFKLTDQDFLGKGTDSGHKADFQGCGEFNPVLMFSSAESQAFNQPSKKAQRDAENSPNRRVVVFIFRPGTKIDVSRWPCPRASEGGAGCQKRFFTDATVRRQFLDNRRTHEKDDNTFACRFYHRLAMRSPCERILRSFRVRLFDPLSRVMPEAQFRLAVNAQVVIGKADAQGFLVARDVKVPGTGLVEWAFKTPDDKAPDIYPFRQEVFFDADEADDDDSLERRLSNLGYNRRPQIEDNVRDFQRNYDKPLSGKLADIKDDLIKFHDSADPPPIVDVDATNSNKNPEVDPGESDEPIEVITTDPP